jgi:hypothetical protein
MTRKRRDEAKPVDAWRFCTSTSAVMSRTVTMKDVGPFVDPLVDPPVVPLVGAEEVDEELEDPGEVVEVSAVEEEEASVVVPVAIVFGWEPTAWMQPPFPSGVRPSSHLPSAEHPSPLSVFPSSHSSKNGAKYPSPTAGG